MGLIYSQIEYYEQVLDLTTQSLEIFRALGDHSREAHALYESDQQAMRLGRWQVARSSFDQAITLYEGLDNRAGLAYLYWGRGVLHHMLGEDQPSAAGRTRPGRADA
jgi:tetratricopeptide (TPR) repeat protein